MSGTESERQRPTGSESAHYQYRPAGEDSRNDGGQPVRLPETSDPTGRAGQGRARQPSSIIEPEVLRIGSQLCITGEQLLISIGE